MVWSTIFANLAAGNQPLSLFDAMFSQIASLLAIPCTASSNNTIALTGLSNAPTLTAYQRYVGFRFRAAGTSSGAVTINFGGIGALNAYKKDGATQVGANDLLSGQEYLAIYDSALNAGAGGFFVEDAAIPLITTVNDLHPGGRLTLTTGVPVPQSNVTGATSVFYTPYLNRFVPLNVNGVMVMTDTGGELSQAANDTTKSPAATANNTNYDMFVWNDGGTIRCTRGPAWSSDTARSNTLARIQGIFTNNSGITNGPAANLGTYVGTVRSNGSATFDFNFSTSGSGGAQANMHCWNMYNRVSFGGRVVDTAAAYTYTSATIRAAGSSSNNRINLTVGINEDTVLCRYWQRCKTVAVSGAAMAVGPAFNSTTSFINTESTIQVIAPTANVFSADAQVISIFQLNQGFQFLQACEQSDGANANIFNTNTSGTLEIIIMM